MNATYYFYRLDDGILWPGTMELPDQGSVEANTPPGYTAITIPGGADWRTQRWDRDSLELVPYEPPERPLEAVEEDARQRRATLLAASDWVTLRALDTGEPVPLAWRQYRQFLRDAPQQSGWPRDVEWPEVPIDT